MAARNQARWVPKKKINIHTQPSILFIKSSLPPMSEILRTIRTAKKYPMGTTVLTKKYCSSSLQVSSRSRSVKAQTVNVVTIIQMKMIRLMPSIVQSLIFIGSPDLMRWRKCIVPMMWPAMLYEIARVEKITSEKQSLESTWVRFEIELENIF
eukprot:TRINITY_DN17579_c0_g1_i1.p2 TRINITY_DN17579_c0_g1~~TRINITY_DN17579_c0_g1_i1.p2  ORF type:complete len:153 (+),score=6.57 TRINITY_DN17579_c0_g1_i1:189-647(+)